MRPFLLLLCSCFWFVSNGQNFLTVTPASQPPYDPNVLIDNYFTGAGIEVLNVEFAGDTAAVGFFSGGAGAVGVERGLILTTGRSATSGTNLGAEETGSEFANTDNGSTATLPALQNISTMQLYNVLYYKITFRPSSDSIRFRYVFASEEYPEYACSSFNDIFGFFLNGPKPDGSGNYSDFNIALIPGTNLPVAINNLHPANGTQPNCPPFNVQYYHDNNGSNVQPVYDGFTDPFLAEASVIPCETYEMIIAIADVGDGVFDSGVFLEGNSFGGAIDVSASFGASENVIPENATADTIAVTFENIPAASLPLTVTIGGDAQNGIDYQPIAAQYTISSANDVLNFVFQPIADTLTEGLESVIINITGGGCLAKQFTLYLSDPDSSMLQGGDITMYALVSGNAHLEVQPTAFSGKNFTFSNDQDLTIEPVNALVTSDIQVSLPFENLNDVKAIRSVCFDADHAWVGDLDVFLISPDNRFVELTTNNGANGDNYTGTCFSPDASEAINAPGPFAPADAAPFTGTFKVEGEWKDIVNTPVTGVWKLGVADQNAGFTGTLKNWSIQFSGLELGGFKYLWSTGDTTRSIDVSTPGTYTVQVSNAVSHFDHTFVVTEEVSGVSSPEAGSLMVQPNPARDFVQISWNKGLNVNQVRVFDHFGKLVMQQKVSASAQGEVLHTGQLQTGTYLISVETAQGNLVRKIVKE